VTKIVLKGDSSLGEVLRNLPMKNGLGFITVRDQFGKVLWSHSVEEWKYDSHDITVQTRDIRERIEESLAVQRHLAEEEYRVKGLL
jgi:hypothetical protein